MEKKAFQAESKRLLDMMIHSIYTHKEIFLRELISNASDAIDKLYFRSLTDDSVNMSQSDFAIDLKVDPEARTLTITDNGIGMTKEELENNLGIIANSGSLQFKTENELKDEDLASIVFSQTSDLKTRNAAAACRKAGYASNVPLFCCQEAEISGSLPLCIRVLITINHARKKEAKMVYLRGASNLRPDLVSRSK